MPKATVQAAILSIPLVSGVEAGNIILTLAVLSIDIAPIDAISIDNPYYRLLPKE